jgi:phospholipid-translocating ATPase
MSSRHPPTDDDVTDDEDDRSIDPELRLRTVRTAASTLAESAAVEQRAVKRKTLLGSRSKKKDSFFRKRSQKKPPAQDSVGPTGPVIPGHRRTIYVNRPLSISELDTNNEPLVRYPRNKVRTTSEPLSLFRAPPHISRVF